MKCIDEEIPFEIPTTWEWCRLGMIVDFSRSISVSPSSISNDLWILDLEDIEKDTGKILRKKTMKDAQSKSDKHTFIKGNVLYSKLRPYLNKVIIADEDGACTSEILALDFLSIYNRYAQVYLMSPFFVDYAMSDAYGVKMPRLGSKQGNNALMPLPPLSEQYRIIERLEMLTIPLEQYDKVQNEINDLNLDIKNKLRKSILQEAIQGCLVPQMIEEGTAEDLLVEIRKKKELLVKEGKLKKSALNDSIIYKGDDNKYYEQINGQTIEIELPYEFPNSWSVLRLKDVCQLIDGEKKTGKGICLDAKYLRGKSSSTIIEKGRFVYAGDNIILVDGENSGEVFSVPHDGYMGSTFKQLWISSVIWKPYVLAFILFYKEELRNSKRGAAIPHLNKDLFYNLPIGIPPYQEQMRIAERINELSQLLK